MWVFLNCDGSNLECFEHPFQNFTLPNGDFDVEAMGWIYTTRSAGFLFGDGDAPFTIHETGEIGNVSFSDSLGKFVRIIPTHGDTMAFIEYVPHRFGAEAMKIIDKANEIIRTYQAAGDSLTLRQLYYRFVASALIPNTERSYKNLGNVISDGRLAGLIDWNAIEDRGRNLKFNNHWNRPSGIVTDCIEQWYTIDKWKNQEHRLEVWVEKEALIAIAERVCRPLDVPFFACKGYVSQSEMHDGAMRAKRWIEEGQQSVIIHLGDHDPSGIDMTRDIRDRYALFIGDSTVERIALNMDQVYRYNPPPNPAKVTDSRAEGYIAQYGNESWELDALEPKVLRTLIQRTILSFRDEDKWEEACQMEEAHREMLVEVKARLEEKEENMGMDNSDIPDVNFGYQHD